MTLDTFLWNRWNSNISLYFIQSRMQTFTSPNAQRFRGRKRANLIQWESAMPARTGCLDRQWKITNVGLLSVKCGSWQLGASMFNKYILSAGVQTDATENATKTINNKKGKSSHFKYQASFSPIITWNVIHQNVACLSYVGLNKSFITEAWCWTKCQPFLHHIWFGACFWTELPIFVSENTALNLSGGTEGVNRFYSEALTKKKKNNQYRLFVVERSKTGFSFPLLYHG